MTEDKLFVSADRMMKDVHDVRMCLKVLGIFD